MSVEDPNSPNSPSGAVLELKNLTIANGRVTASFSRGGGILNVRGSLTVTNCVVRDNRAPYGGGVSNFLGSITINNSNFTGNAATTDWGGGVFNDSSSTTITGSTFAGNTAVTHGGGVGGWGPSAINITDSIFSGNHAAAGGAFIASYVANVVNSTLSDNTADMGGAIYGSVDEGNPFVSVRNSTLSGNSATTQGGALYLIIGLNNVSNSTFSNNSAPDGGGLYGVGDSSFSGINNSTFLNSAIVNPLAVYGFPLPMSNTIVAGSTCSGVTDGGYNIDTGSTCGFSGTSQSNFAGLLLDPQGLGDNGGQTKTIALLAGSTAVNAIQIGTNGCGAAGQTDQRGVLRPQGTGCDIGAFEVVTDTDADGVLDDVDLCPGTLLADFADRPGRPMKNRFFAMGDGKFVDGDGTFSGFTVVDTFGCSGTQIIQAIGIGEGHDKFGITRGVILDWIAANQ
jgi:predicted outer membrane repeat protein